MSHNNQVIRALRLALDESKEELRLRDKAIAAHREAVGQLKTIIASLIPRTDFEENEKETMYNTLGLPKNDS